MTRSVFIASTPLHLLNAFEAMRHFDLKSEDCLLLVWARSAWSQNGIEQLADELGWTQRMVLTAERGRNWMSKAAAIMRLNRVARQWHGAAHCFDAMFCSPFIRHFVNRLNPREYTLLDEGLGQVTLLTQYHQVSAGGSTRKRGWWGRLLHYDRSRQCLYRVFTAYQIQPESGVNVVRHQYHHVRQFFEQAGSRISDDHTLLVGWPAHAFLGDENYLSVVRSVIAELQKSYGRISYIAHKSNSEAVLDEISALPSVTVFVHDGPIEKWLLETDVLPKGVAGFATSVVENVRVLFQRHQLRFHVFRVNAAFESDVSQEFVTKWIAKQQLYDDVYSYYNSVTEPRLSAEEVDVQLADHGVPRQRL